MGNSGSALGIQLDQTEVYSGGTTQCAVGAAATLASSLLRAAGEVAGPDVLLP